MESAQAVPDWLNYFITALITAAVVGIPAYAKIQTLRRTFRTQDIDIESREHQVLKATAIDNRWEKLLETTEAKYQRLIDDKDTFWLARIRERDTEITELKAKDLAQEGQIKDLFDKHVECQRNEARADERAKMNSEHIQKLELQVQTQVTTLIQLQEQLTQLNKKVNPQG